MKVVFRYGIDRVGCLGGNRSAIRCQGNVTAPISPTVTARFSAIQHSSGCRRRGFAVSQPSIEVWTESRFRMPSVMKCRSRQPRRLQRQQQDRRLREHSDGCGYDCLDGQRASYWNSGNRLRLDRFL